MTLEEAIIHCKEKACDNTQCALEHKQLAEWLQELQQYRNRRNIKKKEKQLLYKPKQWALYCNNEFISSYSSKNSAKAALHKKCEEMKKYPYDYDKEYYTIKPYQAK